MLRLDVDDDSGSPRNSLEQFIAGLRDARELYEVVESC